MTRRREFTPEREAVIRESLRCERIYATKVLAAEWGVHERTIHEWRAKVREKMVQA